MRIAMFYHSLRSDWNHGNAHFLRGVARELLARGHDVRVYEPRDAWSVENLARDAGLPALAAYREAYPHLTSERYDLARLDLDRALDGVDLVLVHEWNDPLLVARLGARRRAGGRFRLLFHDTHHRAVTRPDEMGGFDLSGYDGALVFGEVLRDIYARRGWAARTWTWHEAADTEVFRPRPTPPEGREGDVVWVGNWGDDERTQELWTFLLGPIRSLGLRATVHGVRYPAPALAALARVGVRYGGYLPNHRVPQTFARFRLTVHVPRRPYVEALPGIPTIRVFEALACGIPLVCAPWRDAERLFRPGDYLVAEDRRSMRDHIRTVLEDPSAARELSRRGLATVRRRHTCAHRVDELLAIAAELGVLVPEARAVGAE